jgi:putative heme iron utilization protein
VNISIDDVIHLLHSVSHGALATHSERVAGYPYATVLPFVLNEQHHPVFLISSLAEHTKNLLRNPRASLVIFDESCADVLSGARVSLLGDVLPFDADKRFVARYRRYQSDAERYLALGDFAFFRFETKQARAIAGFGAMGWIEPERLSRIASLSLDEEEEALRHVLRSPADDYRLLGLDRYGADLSRAGVRERHKFNGAPLKGESLRRALELLSLAIPR